MAAQCFPLVGGRVMRVTRLDQCGNPVDSECSTVVSDGFVSVATTATLDEPDVIELRNANGRMCVRLRPAPSVRSFVVTVVFCNVDPDLFAIITGQEQVIDADTQEAVGFRVNTDVNPDEFGWALEVWSNVPDQPCDPEGNLGYGYVLYPFLSGGTFGDYTIENGAVTFTVTGAETKSSPGWGVGPYNVIIEGGVPAPLSTPMAAADHLHVQLTYLAPPESTCGCVELDLPSS